MIENQSSFVFLVYKTNTLYKCDQISLCRLICLFAMSNMSLVS